MIRAIKALVVIFTARAPGRRPHPGVVIVLASATILGACVTAPDRAPPASPAERLFTHQAPDFSIRFPASWELRETKEGEYLHAAAGKGAPNIIVAAAERPSSPDPAEFARRSLEGLRSSQGLRQGEIVQAREVPLSDGTRAYEALVAWRHPLYRVDLASLFLLAEKDGTALKLVATDLGQDLSEAHRQWCYSLQIR